MKVFEYRVYNITYVQVLRVRFERKSFQSYGGSENNFSVTLETFEFL